MTVAINNVPIRMHGLHHRDAVLMLYKETMTS